MHPAGRGRGCLPVAGCWLAAGCMAGCGGCRVRRSARPARARCFTHEPIRGNNRVSDGVGHSCCLINICCWIMSTDGCRCLSRGAGSSPQNASPPAPGYRADLLGWTRSAHRSDGVLMTTSRLQFVPVPAPPWCPAPEISGSECERVAGR
jgi:hypothetical protein